MPIVVKHQYLAKMFNEIHCMLVYTAVDDIKSAHAIYLYTMEDCNGTDCMWTTGSVNQLELLLIFILQL